MTVIDLIEYTDGIHVRLTPREPELPPPYLPGDLLRCPHVTPLIVDKHAYGYRLAMTTIGETDLVRGVAAHEAPKCGCWMLIATGTIEPLHQRMAVTVVREAKKLNVPWWKCPNTPPCEHGRVLHDIEDWESLPRCGVGGCECGCS